MSDIIKSSKIKGLATLKKKGFKVPSFTDILDFTELGIESVAVLDHYYNRDIIVQALTAGLQTIGKSQHGYSLRSASYDEDTINKSAAGKYISYNGVRSVEELYQAALMIWKQHRSLSSGVLCPLILQQTHASYFSGVTFKNNDAQESTLVIESYYGSCRNLVNGTVPPYRSVYKNNQWTHFFNEERDECYIFNVHRSLFTNDIEDQPAGIILQPVSKDFPTKIHLYMKPYSDELTVYGYRPQTPPAWYMEKICFPMVDLCDSLEEGEGVDIEWGASLEGELFLYQLRPLTRPVSEYHGSVQTDSVSTQKIYRGLPASEGITRGIISTNINDVDDQTILMLKFASVDKLQALETCQGVVTSIGGMLSHLALICRELKKPCVVGIHSVIPDGTFVVVNGSQGIVEVID